MRLRRMLARCRSTARGAFWYQFGKVPRTHIASMRLFFRLRIRSMQYEALGLGRVLRNRDVRVYVDGRRSFARLERLFRRAKHTLYIQMFIWKDDETGRRVARAVLDAAERGVQVEIVKESSGDFFEAAQDFLGTEQSSSLLWKAFWSHQRIHVSYESKRDHTKAYIIDGAVLLLSGMNIADEYRNDWHDYLIELRGPQYVQEYILPRFAQGEGVAVVANTVEHKGVRPVLRQLLAQATKQVIVEHCYFSDRETIRSLIALTKRGVRVIVIIPSHVDFHQQGNTLAVGELLGGCAPAYIQIFQYPGQFHGKIILVDKVVAFLGSMNLIAQSIDTLGEVNVLIRDRGSTLRKLRNVLRDDIAICRPISALPGLRWLSKILAFFWL